MRAVACLLVGSNATPPAAAQKAPAVTDALTNQTVELLQALIQNQCVNDGTIESGEEVRNSQLLVDYLEGTGLDLETYESAPGRESVVARIEGSDPDAPTICLMGHTDVVPVTPEEWREDPFGGELIDGEVWGRGAIDMLCLTSSMAVAFKHLATSGFKPKGTLIYFGVADEEAGGTYGADYMAENHWDSIDCDYLLTETGGILTHTPSGPKIVLTSAEKGVAWRRLTVKGTPGHGSMPWNTDNALVTAAEVVRRLAEYQETPQINQYWRAFVDAMGLPDEGRAALLDPTRLRDSFAFMDERIARYAHACTHMTFSPNVAHGGTKTNTIPDEVVLDLDIRTLPGQTDEDVEANLRAALGDLYSRVTFAPISTRMSTESATDTPMWDLLSDRLLAAHPQAEVIPWLLVGGTDAAFFRDKGVTAYGAGIFSEKATLEEFQSRFHGIDERVDVDSLALQTQMWQDVATTMLT